MVQQLPNSSIVIVRMCEPFGVTQILGCALSSPIRPTALYDGDGSGSELIGAKHWQTCTDMAPAELSSDLVVPPEPLARRRHGVFRSAGTSSRSSAWQVVEDRYLQRSGDELRVAGHRAKLTKDLLQLAEQAPYLHCARHSPIIY